MQEPSYTSNSSLAKKNIKLAIISITFVLICIIAIYFIGKKYAEASTKNKVNVFNQKRFEDFYKEKNLDMVFLGSSHSYCTFDPEIFDKALDTNSFQLGMPAQYPDASYYTLLEVLNYHKPKVVVLEIYWDILKKEFNSKQADTLFAVMQNKDLEKQYFEEVYPLNEKVKHSIDIIRYQEDFIQYENSLLTKYINEEYDIKKEIEFVPGEEYYRSKGYTFCDIILPKDEYYKTNQFREMDGKRFSPSKEQKEYLQKIVDTCKANDIQLFFVTAPVANVSMDFIENYDVINKKVTDLVNDLGVPYIDFNIINKQEKLFENENFRDDAHLNHSGIEIASNYYINYLKDFIK